MAADIRPGDVVLVDELGQGLVSASIAVGELLRHGRGSPYTRWTHIAIVCDAPYQDPATISIAEATPAGGVHTTFLSKYEKRYAIVHTGVNNRDWSEVQRFLGSVLKARARYDFVAYAGLTLYALTGTRTCIQRAGTATCSGLVADALTRAGFIWTRPPYAMTPADIAADLEDANYTITSRVVDEGQATIGGRLRQLARTMCG